MNVLLITVDCLRYDRVGFNGHHRPTTPVMDDLVEESYVFHNAFSTGPQTVDSFPGFIAGLHSYNAAHVQGNVAWKALPDGCPTLGTYFSNHGYEPGAVLTNTFITEEQNYANGFEIFRNIEMEGFGGPSNDGSDKSLPKRCLDRITGVVRSKLQDQDSIYNPYMAMFVAYQYRRMLLGWPTVQAKEVVNEFTDTLDDLSEPFFGWTHLMDLHAPIHPWIVDEELSTIDSLFRHFVAEGARDGHIHYPSLNTIYDGAVSYVDAQIGRILDYLEERGALDETVVIITSDHGDALYDRGIYGHPSHYLYNELLRVPFLVRIPGGETNHLYQPFSLAWLHELIAEIHDWEPPPFPARSYRGCHLSPNADEDVVVLSDSISQYGHSVAIQNKTHKYVTHFGETGMDTYDESQRDTMYKIASDSWERKPIAGTQAPPHLRERAEEIRIHPADLPSIEQPSDEVAMARLEQLGYTM